MIKPQSCLGCSLHTLGRGFTAVEGIGKNRLLVVGEASGDSEARESLPFRPHAQAGSILERAFMALRTKREDYIITNILRCSPPGNIIDGASYKYSAISHCQPNLAQVVEEYKPTAILALGGTALESLTGYKGKKKGISSLRGYVLWCETFKLPVVATYHPAFIARGAKNLLGAFYFDIIKALKLAKGELVKGKDYYLNPQRDYPNEYALSDNDPGALWQAEEPLFLNSYLPFAFDIETEQSTKEESEDDLRSEYTKITQFQFSTRKGHAVVLPWREPFIARIKKLMALPNPKLSWNGWRFDQPVLEANGLTIAEPHLDLMTMYHHLNPDIPAGLQYAASFYGFGFPWKHLAGESLEFYGACDVDALHYIFEQVVYFLDKEGLLGAPKEQFYAINR